MFFNLEKNKSKLIIVAVAIVIACLYIFRSQLFNLVTPVTTPTFVNKAEKSGLEFLNLPDRFKISIFAKDLNNPRVIAFDPAGRMLVSETKAGQVRLIDGTDKNYQADRSTILLSNLQNPHGLAFYKDDKTGKTYLYIAEDYQVSRYVYDSINSKIISTKGENIANLPKGGQHFTRTIEFGPNYRTKPIISGYLEKETTQADKLYISVGSSCDSCVEDSWKRAAILESDPEGTFTATLAGGLRNSVFFAFNPKNCQMWATEMGRDYLGDNLPPDEINIIKPDANYGWPFCYGNQVKDKKFIPPQTITRKDIPADCSQTEKPKIEIPAHSAPLGLAFVSNDKWPKDWQYSLLVAYHGSWNRSTPTGYKIVRYKLDSAGNVLGVEDFISGWLNGSKIYGRPVDLKFGPDGALYVSDDEAGLIYRVSPN